jgi:hypothetical protein
MRNDDYGSHGYCAWVCVTRLDKVGAQKAVKELAALLLEYRLHSQIDEILADIARGICPRSRCS